MSHRPRIEALRLSFARLAQSAPTGRAILPLRLATARRSAAVGAAALLAVASALWLWPRAAATPPQGPYLTQVAFRGDLDIRVSATGTVEPVRIIDVSTELSGTVKAVHADFNDAVRAGDLLAELDTTSLATLLSRARSTHRLAQARLREGQINLAQFNAELERKRRLVERRIATDREFDLAKAAADRGEAAIAMLTEELAVAAADVELAEAALARARIVSPIDGVVLRRSVEPGQAIAASLQSPVLFRIAPSLNEMQVKVDVDEADALAVQPGQPAAFKGQAQRGQEIPASVQKVYLGPEIVQGVVTYKAILGFDNSALQLKPGMTATADIWVARRRDVLLVPNAALRFTAPKDQPSVSPPGFVDRMIGASASTEAVAGGAPAPSAETPPAAATRRLHIWTNGSLVPVEVSAGQTDGSHTEIVSGNLAAGDLVVIDLREAGS